MELFDAVGRYVGELGDSGVGKHRDGCAVLAGSTALGEPTTSLRHCRHCRRSRRAYRSADQGVADRYRDLFWRL